MRIPAGYDFRIRALNNDQPIGVYVGGSEQIKSPGWDEEGFRKAAEDLGAGQYIVEEYFMIPKDEIRIEKVATNEQHFRATVEVAPSPPFFSWVFTFSGKIRIVSPAAVLEEMRDMAAWLK